MAIALAEQSPQLVDRMVIDRQHPRPLKAATWALIANCGFTPVIGEMFWRIKPDFSIRKGLEVAFAPGFTVPDAFVEDVNG